MRTMKWLVSAANGHNSMVSVSVAWYGASSEIWKEF